MKQNFWTKSSAIMRIFFVVAFAFLVIGLGTLGSFSSFGKSYEVTKDEEIIIHVSIPDNLPSNLSASKLYVKRIYLNVGTVYAEKGSTAEVCVARGTSATGSFGSTRTVTLPAVYETVAEGKKATALNGALYNWTMIDLTTSTSSTSGWRVSTYNYYRLTTNKANVRINEIVFAAETENGSDGAVYLLKTEIDDASVIARNEGEKLNAAIERVGAIIDSPVIPTMAQSSFFRFTEEEVYTLMTIEEMKVGSSFLSNDVYHIDTVYGALGTDLIALSTLVFGTSPFALRLLPFLAAFGILLVGFFLVKRLTGSERAGLIFAVLYVLSSVFFVAGHLGTPLTIGLFFLVLALSLCHKFYAEGLKNTGFKASLPVLASALFSALAICVNGALTIPVLAIVGLFVAGMLRQQKAKEYYLNKALDEATNEIALAEEENVADAETKGKEKVAAVLKEYSIKNAVAILYGAILVIGTCLLMLLSALPMYYAYVKAFDAPAAPQMSILAYVWNAFAGGFTATNVTTVSANPWIYTLFVGSGERYAVTATGYLFGGFAVIAGIFGAVFALVRLICNLKNKSEDKTSRAQNRSAIILLGACVAMAICSFLGNSLLATVGVMLFLFALAGVSVDIVLAQEDRLSKTMGVLTKVWIVLLAIGFVLTFAITFSLPIPEGILGLLF